MNLFIPDARIGWYFSALPAGNELLRKEKFDAIVSIGPPHTTHLIGKSISRKNKIPHIPVFIDPWVDIAYYREFKRNPLTLAIDNHLEKSVMKNAGSIVFVTRTMKNDYSDKYNFIKGKSNVLYWGYNEDNFENLKSQNSSDSETIIHAGNIFDFQNPKCLRKKLKMEESCG